MSKTKIKKYKTRKLVSHKSHKYIFSINQTTSKISQIKNGISLSEIRILPENLKNNKEVALKAIETDVTYIDSISNTLKDDIDIAKKIMEKNPKYFEKLSERIRDNKEIALNAVKTDASLYNFVSERLKIDEDILNATDFDKVYEPSFKFKQKIDKTTYLKLLKSLGRYKSFSSNLLISVTDDVLNDKNIVIKTIKLSKNSYESLPIHLKKDDDVVETLIKNNNFYDSDLTKYFSDYDKNLAILIMKYHAELYPKLKPEFQMDKDVILNALKSKLKKNLYGIKYTTYGVHTRDILPFIPENMKQDKEIKQLLELKNNSYYFSKNHNDDKKFILKNVHRWNTFQYVSDRLKQDKDVVISALTNPARGKYYPDTLLTLTTPKIRQDKVVFLKALENRMKINKKEQLKLNKTNKLNKCKNKSKKKA
jgi:hypothetical protein